MILLLFKTVRAYNCTISVVSEQKSKSSIDLVVAAAGHIAKEPASGSTAVLYSHNVRKYESLLQEIGIYLKCFDYSR